jgi:hypothetical protein
MKHLITLDLSCDHAPTVGDLLPTKHGAKMEVIDYKAISSNTWSAAHRHYPTFRVWLRAVAREDAR